MSKKIESVSLQVEIEMTEKKLLELKKEKERVDSKEALVFSDYNLPPALEAIIGHVVMFNKTDYVVSLVHHNDSYLVFDIVDAFDINFVAVNKQYTYDGDVIKTTGQSLFNTNTSSNQIEIFGIDKNEHDWFIVLFRYAKKGYVIERIPVNSVTGEPYYDDVIGN